MKSILLTTQIKNTEKHKNQWLFWIFKFFQLNKPRQSPTIIENSAGRTLVTDGILATDPDGTANLVFNIDWDESYATKSGQVTDEKFYEK